MTVKLSGAAQPKQKSVPAEIRNLSFRQKSTLSKTRISSSYPKFGDLMKWDVQTIPTTASFTGWCIIPLANSISSRTRSKQIENARVLTLKSEQKKVTANIANLNFGTFPKMMFQG